MRSAAGPPPTAFLDIDYASGAAPVLAPTSVCVRPGAGMAPSGALRQARAAALGGTLAPALLPAGVAAAALGRLTWRQQCAGAGRTHHCRNDGAASPRRAPNRLQPCRSYCGCCGGGGAATRASESRIAPRNAVWCMRKAETWPPDTRRSSLPARLCICRTLSTLTYASSVAATITVASVSSTRLRRETVAGSSSRLSPARSSATARPSSPRKRRPRGGGPPPPPPLGAEEEAAGMVEQLGLSGQAALTKRLYSCARCSVTAFSVPCAAAAAAAAAAATALDASASAPAPAAPTEPAPAGPTPAASPLAAVAAAPPRPPVAVAVAVAAARAPSAAVLAALATEEHWPTSTSNRSNWMTQVSSRSRKRSLSRCRCSVSTAVKRASSAASTAARAASAAASAAAARGEGGCGGGSWAAEGPSPCGGGGLGSARAGSFFSCFFMCL
ncbi:hypothetical protein TSOC_010886 [Tetrabaena socialis]|uniref:Uncharacterized protein n=1 Tax=Tetrabaena socialis TaxID=47790 RepID=A0A2J7ZS46_9CHLO|nr:hypothetical protein TSOC_010886 [Tetrabaena socialis]|eukprot:PNH03099.1 hypothetical protein TSOC_010886 [Tetrabaena socialis]